MNLFSKLKNAKNVLNVAARNSNLLVEMGDVDIKMIQGKLLEIYHDILRVCQRNDINVVLSGGSALGAVRHKGFIPWDDDMDLAMSRKDYNKFCSVFEVELGDRYILNAPNYCKNAKGRFPRVLKKDSYYETIIDVHDKALQKLYMDIFIIENIPDNKVYRFFKGHMCDVLHFISGQVYAYECRDEDMKKYFLAAGKSYYYARMCIGFLFSFIKSSKWFDMIDRISQYQDDSSALVGTVTGRQHYFGEMMPRDVWFPYSIGTFENEKVLLHHDPDRYLKAIYGDYMKIPEPENRERHFVYKMEV